MVDLLQMQVDTLTGEEHGLPLLVNVFYSCLWAQKTLEQKRMGWIFLLLKSPGLAPLNCEGHKTRED